LHALSVGQPVSAYIKADPSKKFKRDYLFGESLANDRMAEVYCHFDRYNASLVSGMFVERRSVIEVKMHFLYPKAR